VADPVIVDRWERSTMTCSHGVLETTLARCGRSHIIEGDFSHRRVRSLVIAAARLAP